MEKKLVQSGEKFVPPEISMFRLPPGDLCAFSFFHAKQSIFLLQHLFEFHLNN